MINNNLNFKTKTEFTLTSVELFRNLICAVSKLPLIKLGEPGMTRLELLDVKVAAHKSS